MCEPGTLNLGVQRLVHSVISPIPACIKCRLIAKELIRTHEINQRTGDNLSISYGGRTFTATEIRNELLKEAGWACIELVPFFSGVSQYSNYQRELAHEKTGTRIYPVNSHVSKHEQHENEIGRLAVGERLATLLRLLHRLEIAECNLKPLIEAQPT